MSSLENKIPYILKFKFKIYIKMQKLKEDKI